MSVTGHGKRKRCLCSSETLLTSHAETARLPFVEAKEKHPPAQPPALERDFFLVYHITYCFMIGSMNPDEATPIVFAHDYRVRNLVFRCHEKAVIAHAKHKANDPNVRNASRNVRMSFRASVVCIVNVFVM